MLAAFVPLLFALGTANGQDDAAIKQLLDFKENTMGPIGIMTTASGAPVEYREARNIINSKLVSNEHFMDEITSLVRERIPERVVHAPGAGAFGYFETTHDISHICKAKLFSEVGKKTPVAVRFSIGFSSIGVADTVRETRGFSVKFYTEEGNLDLPGLNTPVFAFKDPLLFTPISHVSKPNPVSNLPDPNMVWDYMTQNPEGLFSNLYILSDLGTPAGYNHMPGYPIHTYQVYNEKGVSSFMKFHFLPVAGIKNFNSSEILEISTRDSHYYARSLYNSIANGDYPSWYLKAQIISEEDMKNTDLDIFDVTTNLPFDQFPLQDIGIFTLEKNPDNYFAEIEQIAFCPGNLVPGILGSPDIVFEARRLAYREAHLYRLGSNFHKIPVNCPIHDKTHTYIRDGAPPVNDNGKNAPSYYPNSFNGAVPYKDKKRPSLLEIYEKPSNNFKQAGQFYSNKLCPEEQNTLVDNILKTLCLCDEMIKKRAVKWYKVIHPNLGDRVAEGLANCTS